MLRLPPTLCPGCDARAIRLRCLVPPVLTLPALPQSHSHHIIAPRQFPLEIGFLFLFLFLLSCLVSSSLVLSVPLLCPTPCPSIARLIKSYSANLETNINLVEAINLHQSAPPTYHNTTQHHTTQHNSSQPTASKGKQLSSIFICLRPTAAVGPRYQTGFSLPAYHCHFQLVSSDATLSNSSTNAIYSCSDNDISHHVLSAC